MNDDARPPAPPRTAAGAPTVAVSFSHDVGWSGMLAMEIQRAGESTVMTTYNDDGRPEIGVWRTALPADRFDALVARLRASGYERLETPAAPMMPGTKTFTIGERLAGQALPVMRTFARTHEALGPVLAALAELRGAIAAHPLRVLRGQASWQASRGTAEVQRGAPAVLDVTLTNAGSAPIEIGSPLAVASGWSGIRLVLRKASAPGAGEQPLDLVAADLRPSPGGPRGDAPTLVLGPGQSLRFEARKAIDVAAGQYVARLEYHGVVTRDGDPLFVGGTLALDPGPLTVKRGPWWKLW